VVRTCNQWVAGSSPGCSASRTTLGELFTYMCLCSLISINCTGQRAVMLSGWEGNRRSGVALAMRHRLSGNISTYMLNGLGKGNEHPAPRLSCIRSTTASLPLPSYTPGCLNKIQELWFWMFYRRGFSRYTGIRRRHCSFSTNP